MSENKHEVPLKDRGKYDKRFPLLPEAKGYFSKQENYVVNTGDPVAKDFGFACQHYNVRAKKLERE